MANEGILLFAYGQMGTYALKGLADRFNVMGIVTPPEGENRFRTEAVRKTEDLAASKGIAVHRDPGLKGLYNLVKDMSPRAVVICSYDKILPANVLELSEFINVHHGDLPRYRGRANLNWAIINGRDSIDVSIHEAVPDLDAGRIYEGWNIPIGSDDYISDIYAKVNNSVEKNLPSLIDRILSRSLTPVAQTGSPTYCCTRMDEDGKIDWNLPATNIRNLIRGVSKPLSGAFCYLHNPDAPANPQKLVIWRADLFDSPRVYEGNIPGRVGRVLKGRGVEVLTATDPILVTEVNLGGKDCKADQVMRSMSLTLR